MTDFLREWIVSIAILSIAGGFFLMLCPEGEMKKNVKLVLSLLLLLAVIGPFFGNRLKVSEKDVLKELKNMTESTEADTGALDGSINAAALVLENEIRTHFTDEGLLYSYVKAELSVESDSYSLKTLTLYTKPEERQKAEDILINSLKTDKQCIIVKELE